MPLASRLEACLYRWTPWHALLWPVSLVLRLLVALRRTAYRRGWLHAVRLPVPVVVVGNIQLGGTGKTPSCIALARTLRATGWSPGIISRGHGSHHRHPRPVDTDSLAAEVGDEPLLLARATGCPVWVGHDRAAVGLALLAAHPQCNLILCDDGLQHLRLQRDLELVVVDFERGLGTGQLLPAGPLREPLRRLRNCNAVLLRGQPPTEAHTLPHPFRMTLRAEQAYQAAQPTRQRAWSAFAGQRVAAVAGIGHPERFFRMLEQAGLQISRHPFPDHHPFSAADLALPDAEIILLTDKDAVKCPLPFDARIWICPVQAEFDPPLEPWLTDQLKRHPHGPQTA